MTDEERRLALERLHSSREKFANTIAGVSHVQAQFKPSPGQWSILELAEHIAISDESLRALIRRALDSPAQPELHEQVQSNDFRYHRPFRPHPKGVNKAPESMQPHNRFSTLEAAAAEFHRQRHETIAYATVTQDPLRDHMVNHPVFGPMDAYQWLMACSIHVESHSHHMEELKQDPGYPAA
jgi:DinB superfamily